MEPLISVIVPIYKVEQYLHKCVDSILNQTYQNLEVILVDDGSPDNCGVICDEYAAKDSRITVIHKPNGGLSDARNAGMLASTGTFLMFVDSDDWLSPDCAEYLYSLLKKHDAQLAIGGRERISDLDGKVLHTDFDGTESVRVMDRMQAMRSMFHNGCASWARLYKRDIHIDTLFPVGEINEDEAIVLQILNRCSRIVESNRIIYKYRCRPESITSTLFSVKKLDWPKHARQNLVFVQREYPELVQFAAGRYRGSLLWALREIALSDSDFKREALNLQKALRKHDSLFRTVSFRSIGDKFRYFLLKNFPLFVYKAILFVRHST